MLHLKSRFKEKNKFYTVKYIYKFLSKFSKNNSIDIILFTTEPKGH